MRRSAMFHGIKLTAFVVARAFLGLVIGLSLWSALPMAIQWKPTVVMSGSMESSIMTGDIIIADPVSPQELNAGLLGEGHVILADDPADEGTLFTHRIVRVMKDGSYMTKGDANAKADTMFVQPESVIGIERLRVPLIGIPIREAKTGNYLPAVLFVFLLTASMLLVQADRKRHKEMNPDLAEAMEVNGHTPSSFNSMGKALSSVLLLVIAGGAIITPVLHSEGSEAFFSASTMNTSSRFKAASTFPVSPAGGNTIPYPENFSKKHSYSIDFTMPLPITSIKSSLSTGFVPVVTWEPKAYNTALNQNDYRPNRVINGSLDVYLNSIAKQLTDVGDPRVVIRLAPGANNPDTLWTEKGNGNAKGSYKLAWRYIVDLFKSKGLKNTAWAWTLDEPVAANEDAASVYPGTAYVNYAGLNFSAFTVAGVPASSSPAIFLGTSLNKLTTVAPDKNVLIFQKDSVPANPTAVQIRWSDDLNSYFHTWNQGGSMKVSGVLGLTY